MNTFSYIRILTGIVPVAKCERTYTDRNTNASHTVLHLSLGYSRHSSIMFSIPKCDLSGHMYDGQIRPLCLPHETDPHRMTVLLGFTLAREYNPSLRSITVCDQAHYSCVTPHGTQQFMPASCYDLAFYQQCHYERLYGAVMNDPETKSRYETDRTMLWNSTYRADLFAIHLR